MDRLGAILKALGRAMTREQRSIWLLASNNFSLLGFRAAGRWRVYFPDHRAGDVVPVEHRSAAENSGVATRSVAAGAARTLASAGAEPVGQSDDLGDCSAGGLDGSRQGDARVVGADCRSGCVGFLAFIAACGVERRSMARCPEFPRSAESAHPQEFARDALHAGCVLAHCC